MKFFNKYKNVLSVAAGMVIGNIISQEDWGLAIGTAVLFVVLAIILPPLITFMSDDMNNRR